MHIKEGTFTPAPQRSSKFAMASAQGLIESKLMLRHGEQLVLSICLLYTSDAADDVIDV